MAEAMGLREFPLRVGIASLVMTGLGLTLCALGVRWQAGPGGGEILDRAWVYWNMAMVLMTMLVWPCVHRIPAGVPRLVGLMWEMCVVIVCAVPVMSVCAVLSSVGVAEVILVAAMQVGLMILTVGVLLRGKGWGLVALGFLAAGVPLLVYVQMEFFPASDVGWSAAVPMVGIASAARGGLGMAGYGVAVLWAALGIGVGLLRRR